MASKPRGYRQAQRLKPEGGETTYLLVTPEGAEAEFVFSDSLLARPDGMYTVEALSTEELGKVRGLEKCADCHRQDEGRHQKKNGMMKRWTAAQETQALPIERNGFERASFSWYNQGRKNGVRP